MNSLLKIRIITHHAVHNHGAVLQLYALEKVLSKYDPNVCALDYQKNYDFLDENANTKYNISIKSIPYYLGFLRKNGFTKTFFNVKKKRCSRILQKRTHYSWGVLFQMQGFRRCVHR